LRPFGALDLEEVDARLHALHRDPVPVPPGLHESLPEIEHDLALQIEQADSQATQVVDAWGEILDAIF
jgi:hypothetical protein